MNLVENKMSIKYETISPGDFFLPESDLEIINRFLRKKLKSGSSTMKNYKNALIRFLNFVHPVDLYSLNRSDGEKYCLYLDSRAVIKGNSALGSKLTTTTKKNYTTFLRGFFTYYEDQLPREARFKNPIPKYFEFTETEVLSIDATLEKEAKKMFTVDQIITILKKSYLRQLGARQINQKVPFYAFLLNFSTGARINEILTIRREDIRPRERYFRTGITVMAQKGRKTFPNGIYFCFPDEIQVYLEEYLLMRDNNPKTKNSPWLFPAKNPDRCARKEYCYKFLKNLDLNFNCTKTHKFRHTYTTLLANKNNKVDDRDINLLTNHVPTDIIHRKYIHKPIEERRAIYDRTFPKEFSKILNFLTILNSQMEAFL